MFQVLCLPVCQLYEYCYLHRSYQAKMFDIWLFVTDLERNNLLISENNTIIATTQKPLVLHCPFDSHPPANITWIVNKTQIVINNYATGPHENRRVKGFINILTHITYYRTPITNECWVKTTCNKVILRVFTDIISCKTEAYWSLIYACQTLVVIDAMLQIAFPRKPSAAMDTSSQYNSHPPLALQIDCFQGCSRKT